MRMKKFTLLTLALFLMSVVAFAQKPATKECMILPQFAKEVKHVELPSGLKVKSLIGIMNAPQKEASADVVTPPKDLVTQPFTFIGYDSNNEPFERIVNVGVDGTDVYIQGLSYYFQDAWIMGTLNADGSITFAIGQFYGNYMNYYPIYFMAYDFETGDIAESVTVTYNPATGDITWPDVLIIDNANGISLNYYEYYEISEVVPGTEPEPLTPPVGMEANVVEYRLVAQAYDANGESPDNNELPIFIAFDGNDVWVKGVCEDMPNTWIMGTMDGNTVTFPTGQHLYTYEAYSDTYKGFFAGYDLNTYSQADVTMTFDNSTGIFTMTSPDLMLINSAWLLVNPNLVFTDVQFVPVPEVAAIPAQPEITYAWLSGDEPYIEVNIPIDDEDGNPILSSKLYYKYYYDVERTVNELTLIPDDYLYLTDAMTEIPYTFLDDGVQGWDICNNNLYLNMDFSTWNKIGIQSIYRGGGEENTSDIFWYTLKPYENQHDIFFTTEGEYTIQNGGASVIVEGEDVTDNVDASGKLASIDEDFTVTLKPATGYKILSFEASYKEAGSTVTINYEFNDSWGDGWNGNAIQIVNASTGEVVETLTLEYNYYATGSVELDAGESYNFVWVKGSYPSECSFTITDANGDEIVSATSGSGLSGTIASYTAPGTASETIAIDVDLDERGASASFVMPNTKVNLTYELERLGYPVEVAAGKYITYYSDKAVTIYDEDCEMLTVTAIDDATVTATPLDVAAAKTPLLIYNSSKKTKELWIIPIEDATEELTPDEVEVAPEFKGTIEEKTFTAAEMNAAEHFICNGEAFIWVRSAGTIGANKCWLELGNDEPLTARAIVIGSGETTAITNVYQNENENRYYDLQGRRVAQPANGLYINNGKKVVVK